MDSFSSRSSFRVGGREYEVFRLDALDQQGIATRHLPYSLRILLENLLRTEDGHAVIADDVRALAAWKPAETPSKEIAFTPSRVLMQDFTGVPAVVDLAAMRDAMVRLGGDPERINPLQAAELVIDHSVQVDEFGSPQALELNAELEYQRNRERYSFLRWGQTAFQNFRVVPPATGIVHQVNLEYLARVVFSAPAADGKTLAYPDTLVGTDSHTTMINGLGVLGWGVGGIEAEAAILGQPLVMIAPEVVGFRLAGALPEGTTATDLVLTVTQMLRRHGVVGKFVEFFGPGLSSMSLPDRATLGNMSPEYGATVGYFPVDDETLRYLRITARDEAQVELIERYYKTQGLFRTDQTPDPQFSEVLTLDLATVEPSLAGPKRPQDRVALSDMKQSFREILTTDVGRGGFGLAPEAVTVTAPVGSNGHTAEIGHGAVVIAAITSCTNTSNPSVMVGAGLLAKKALERGLAVKPYVKTSMAPGSRVVTEYLQAAGLLEPLAELGFNIVGYGCTTCIGNSGPLPGEVVKAISEANLVAASVLSGNRNFEGRINPHTRASFLASPPLVVAFALAGRADIDMLNEPLGTDPSGAPVFLREIWPSQSEIRGVIERSLTAEMFRRRYQDVFSGNPTWNAIPVSGGELYEWSPDSTYIQEPPFFVDLRPELPPAHDIRGARVLAVLGHSVTTDHISPAGAIPASGPAGQYLIERGVQPRDFNSFGSRRGNDRVMTRGTFANIRIKNLLLPGVEGGETLHFPDRTRLPIFEAARRYREEGIPLLVLAGKEYGAGSSRDWAAKGTALLGVKAVLAESFERIHRSNLVGMGVLPLEYLPGQGSEALALTGEERFDVLGLENNLAPGGTVQLLAGKSDGSAIEFQARVRIDTPIELDYYRNGGILHMVLRQLLQAS
ncbi:MAG: aconitate hydratase AcnA [Anaerolineales bacterium]